MQCIRNKSTQNSWLQQSPIRQRLPQTWMEIQVCGSGKRQINSCVKQPLSWASFPIALQKTWYHGTLEYVRQTILSMTNGGKEGGKYSHSKCKYETQHIQLQLGHESEHKTSNGKTFLCKHHNTSYGGVVSNIDHRRLPSKPNMTPFRVQFFKNCSFVLIDK